jgi:hypothetical protein
MRRLGLMVDVEFVRRMFCGLDPGRLPAVACFCPTGLIPLVASAEGGRRELFTGLRPNGAEMGLLRLCFCGFS